MIQAEAQSEYEKVTLASRKEWAQIRKDDNKVKFPDEWEEYLPYYYERLIWPCVHADYREPSTVIYFKNKDDLYAGKYSQLRVGKFLREQYGDDLIDFEHLVDHWRSNANRPEISFAKTPEEIEHVFRSGPHSCMVGKFYTLGHPTRVYGAGDLAVAYLSRGGRIKARCMCWPDKKIMNKCYGDTSLLNKAMQNLGYKYSPKGFQGARLTKEIEGDWYLMPFIDGHKIVTMFKDHFKIGQITDDLGNPQGQYFSPSTERGYALLGTKCNGCGDKYAEPAIPQTSNGMQLCRTCYREATWECDVCGGRVYTSWSKKKAAPIASFIVDYVLYSRACRACYEKHEGKTLPHRDDEHFTIRYGSDSMTEDDAFQYAKEEGYING